MQLRFRRIAPVLLVSSLLIFCSSFLPAQKIPEIDVYGGYSYIRFNSQSLGFSDYSNLTGWAAAITAPHLYEQLGLTLKASGDYGSLLTEYNFLIGPQFSLERGRLRLFGDALFGKAETKVTVPQSTRGEISSEGRAVAFGGGLELSFAHHISVRPIDADYVFSKTFNSNQNYVRVSAGLVYQFGRK